MSKWVVADIGCIECGEETKVPSVHESKEDAVKAMKRYARSKGVSTGPEHELYVGYFAGGQHSIEVLEVGGENVE